MNVKSWKSGEKGEPSFPANFTVQKKAVLQVTDIKTNRNKYYAIELHSSKSMFRVFTHYGRTDDLDSNPNAGIRESRYCRTLEDAESVYRKIYSEKTSTRKGYKELNLASSKIGSSKTIGQSCGVVDDKTLKKLAQKPSVKKPLISIDPKVQELTEYIYSEATKALVNTVNVSITAKGIETPLGILTLGQIDKGQDYLDQIAAILSQKNSKSEIVRLTGEFYTVVPHKFGRSKDAAQQSVIDNKIKLAEKQDTLQLMRDMLNVNSNGNVLMNPEIENKYLALNCDIQFLNANCPEHKKISSLVGRKIKNIFTLKRKGESDVFDKTVGNEKLLFHGSGLKNWVGILSRGILLPKMVTKLGVHRTDAGWLGNGIYFGDVIKTSLSYAAAGRKGTSLVAVVNVALGKIKKFTEITYGLNESPNGYNSCHGVPGRGSEFYDNEFVVYRQNQQELKYLVEI